MRGTAGEGPRHPADPGLFDRARAAPHAHHADPHLPGLPVRLQLLFGDRNVRPVSYRLQSAERVMEEIIARRQWRASHWIFFVDDHFAANLDRTDKLLDLMLAAKIKTKAGARRCAPK